MKQTAEGLQNMNLVYPQMLYTAANRSVDAYQHGRRQPKSLAAASRNTSVNPVASLLWASHLIHLSMSACQSIVPMLMHRYGWSQIPFLSLFLRLLDLAELPCMISRRTDVLRARTCALGWERQRTVADKRHCTQSLERIHTQHIMQVVFENNKQDQFFFFLLR